MNGMEKIETIRQQIPNGAIVATGAHSPVGDSATTTLWVTVKARRGRLSKIKIALDESTDTYTVQGWSASKKELYADGGTWGELRTFVYADQLGEAILAVFGEFGAK